MVKSTNGWPGWSSLPLLQECEEITAQMRGAEGYNMTIPDLNNLLPVLLGKLFHHVALENQ